MCWYIELSSGNITVVFYWLDLWIQATNKDNKNKSYSLDLSTKVESPCKSQVTRSQLLQSAIDAFIRVFKMQTDVSMPSSHKKQVLSYFQIKL